MFRYFFSAVRFTIFVLAFGLPFSVFAQEECVVITAPAPNTVVISKTPEIKAEFRCAIKPESLVVLFDAVDVTQILERSDKGFRYEPDTMSAAGSHFLKISYLTPEGAQKQQEMAFVTRHTTLFGEAYSRNTMTAVYTGAPIQTTSAQVPAEPFNTNTPGSQPSVAPSSTAAIPRSKIEANLASENKVREGSKGVTLAVNARYLDQDLAAADPLRKGITVANWLLTGDYEQDQLKAKFSAGDIILNETPFTVANLSRKGTILSGEYGPVFLNAFSSRMETTYGLDGGVGIGNPDRDTLLGASGGLKLFNNQLEARVIFASGTDPSTPIPPVVTPSPPVVPPPDPPANTFGTTGAPGQKSGNVTSFLLKTDFFAGKARTEIEAAASNFDPDISDEFGKQSSAAYRAKMGGTINWFTYEAGYEYAGKSFGVVGNAAQPKDRQGFNVMGGINFTDQNLSINANRYVDNVENDPLFARTASTTGTFSYQFRKIPHVPLGFAYTKSIQENVSLPAGQNPVDLHTDTYTGQIGLSAGAVNLTFAPSYSLINDKSPTDADTTSITYALTGAYAHPVFSFTPAFSWNRSRNHQTDVWSDIYTGSADVQAKFFNSRATFNIGGTYALSKANDATINNENWNGRTGLSYNIGDHWKKLFIKPVASVRCNYLRVTDKVNPAADKDEFTVLLVLEAAATIFF